MMIDFGRLGWIILVAGWVIGFGLWAFRLIPWWLALLGPVGLAVILVGLLTVIGIMSWMASGSH